MDKSPLVNSEWALMSALAECQSDQGQLSAIILAEDFTGRPEAQDLAMHLFLLTKENIAVNKDAAEKLASFSAADGLRSVIRFSLLSELLCGHSSSV